MKNRIPENHWLLNRASAHRGFHGNGVPENSMLAFKKAIELNYPIETDVQSSKDGVLFCFHDDKVNRMTGFDSRIWDMTAEEIKKLKLNGSEEKIPTFVEFLNFVGGRVPLLIEIKSQPKNEEVVKKIIELLDGYSGEFVIQSFDPRILRSVRILRPEIIRGQLIDKDRHKELKFVTDFLLSHGLLNFMSKPDFININKDYLPVSRRLKGKRHVLCWTVTTMEEERKAHPYVKGYVFENIDPTLKQE